LLLSIRVASKKDYLAGNILRGTAKNRAANMIIFPIVITVIGIEEITTAEILN
jgi:hypothetical protein